MCTVIQNKKVDVMITEKMSLI